MDEPFSALDVLTAETLRTDLIELWVENKLPLRSILIVTHNIEEAVLMCDRVVIFAANPGRIAAEIKIDLAYPRNRNDEKFRKLVDDIYGRMTNPHDPALKMEQREGRGRRQRRGGHGVAGRCPPTSSPA